MAETISYEQIQEFLKLNPQYEEKRTRRAQIVLTPSLYEKVNQEAKKANISFNEYVIRALEHEVKDGRCDVK